MGFLKDRFKSIKNQNIYTLNDKNLLSLLGLDSNNISSGNMGEIVFYTCLNILSNAVGKLPIYQYSYDDVKGREKNTDNNLRNILNIEPNKYMTAMSFWACVELNRNFYGNSYVYIKRHNSGKMRGQVESLWILDSENVTVWRDNAGIFGTKDSIFYVWYDPNNNGKKYIFSCDDILHYKTPVSFDGIVGLAVKDVLKMQLDTQKYSQNYISNLYKNNMFGDKIMLQYTGDLDEDGKDSLIQGIEYFANANSTKFLPIPLGVQAQLLSMKLSDAEFSMINNTNALRIASAFQLSPNHLNDYSKSSYANSVTQQTDFYVNCLMPILEGYKQENTRKLLSSDDKLNGKTIEHNPRDLFKLDPTAHMTYLKEGVNNMIIMPSEAREELGYSYVDGADVLIGNGNLVTLDIIKTGANYKNIGERGDKVEK